MEQVKQSYHIDEIVSIFAQNNYLLDISLINFEWNKLELTQFLNFISKQDIPNNLITRNFVELFLDIKKPVAIPLSIISTENPVKIVKSYELENRNCDVKDWVEYYNDRYNQLGVILRGHVEMKDSTSIAHAFKMAENEIVSIIGVVKEIRKTKNGNYFFSLEDPTSELKCVVNSYKKELFNLCKEIVLDEVIGVKGKRSKEFLWVDSIIFPDAYLEEVKQSPREGYALFLSDIHVGSNRFMAKEFRRFIDWLSGKEGSEKQKEVASKVRYVFFLGDLVDGIGIYPNQEKELTITDIYKQYEELAKYLLDIPERIQLIIMPGNHDALRIAEPQHKFFNDICKPLYELKNATIVSNPSLVNIDAVGNFGGINVLGYHGYSYDYYANEVESVREAGSYDAVDELMKLLLKKRHLAPTHGSTPLVATKKDFLVIDTVPDIFASGHIHKSKIGLYKKITLISASCWQSKTLFQEKLGHNPSPCVVPAVNLKTRETFFLNFGVKNEN